MKKDTWKKEGVFAHVKSLMLLTKRKRADFGGKVLTEMETLKKGKEEKSSIQSEFNSDTEEDEYVALSNYDSDLSSNDEDGCRSDGQLLSQETKPNYQVSLENGFECYLGGSRGLQVKRAIFLLINP